MNKSGGLFEEILFCSNGKTNGVLNIKSSNAMGLGTTTPLGVTPSHLELATNSTVRLRIDGTTGNISLGGIPSFNTSYTLEINGIMKVNDNITIESGKSIGLSTSANLLHFPSTSAVLIGKTTHSNTKLG